MKKIFISVALLALPFFGAMAQSIVATNQIIDCGQVLYQTPATFDFEVKNKSNQARAHYRCVHQLRLHRRGIPA